VERGDWLGSMITAFLDAPMPDAAIPVISIRRCCTVALVPAPVVTLVTNVTGRERFRFRSVAKGVGTWSGAWSARLCGWVGPRCSWWVSPNGREVEPGVYSGEGTADSFSPRIRRLLAVSLPPTALTCSVALASPKTGMLP
jgi:hypothetical protein